MAKPKPPTGCRIKGGRYYRVFYAGKVDGKIKTRWVALSRVDEGLPALYRALADLDNPPAQKAEAIQDDASHDVFDGLSPLLWLKTNWPKLRFTGDEIVAKSVPFEEYRNIETYSGIYFLINENRIVYVGQSLYIGTRIADHYYKSDKRFDRVFHIDAAEPLLNWIETQYIHTFMPELNKDIPSWILRLP